ncbi:MAG: hypothetical protein WAW87_10625, partial [Candidatus Ferrigenium altingense]
GAGFFLPEHQVHSDSVFMHRRLTACGRSLQPCAFFVQIMPAWPGAIMQHIAPIAHRQTGASRRGLSRKMKVTG